ncbi:MAG: ketopantoate reductase C-terminal domain-containing protein, partial [Pseudomonadota bacterium]
KVISLVIAEYSRELQTPWAPLPLPELCPADIAKIAERERLQIERINKRVNFTSLLVRPGHDSDSTQQINTTEGSFHITKSAKIRSKCKLGSRKVNMNDISLKAISSDFFQTLGICIGLGTSIELFLEDAILQKLAVNFILNPISALCPQSIGILINTANIKALMLKLNDQFCFMVTQVLGLRGDILYKGELFITDRLALSAAHVASTGQSVKARRRIEFTHIFRFSFTHC